MQHLETDAHPAAFRDWVETSPPKPVCGDGIDCQTMSKPGKAWTVVHSGEVGGNPFCFGAWTARLVVGSGEVIGPLNAFTQAAVEAERLSPIPPQPDWIEGPNLSIAEVYRVNAPSLENLKTYLGCSAQARPFVINLYLYPEHLVRFEAQLLGPDLAEVWRKSAPCVARVS